MPSTLVGFATVGTVRCLRLFVFETLNRRLSKNPAVAYFGVPPELPVLAHACAQEEKEQRAVAEREKRKQLKAKAKERLRGEKERAAAEKAAAERAEKDAAERAALASRERDELEKCAICLPPYLKHCGPCHGLG